MEPIYSPLKKQKIEITDDEETIDYNDKVLINAYEKEELINHLLKHDLLTSTDLNLMVPKKIKDIEFIEPEAAAFFFHEDHNFESVEGQFRILEKLLRKCAEKKLKGIGMIVYDAGHYSTLFIEFEQDKFVHYDSIPGYHGVKVKNFMERVNLNFDKSFRYVAPKLNRQPNNIDCGYYSVVVARLYPYEKITYMITDTLFPLLDKVLDSFFNWKYIYGLKKGTFYGNLLNNIVTNQSNNSIILPEVLQLKDIPSIKMSRLFILRIIMAFESFQISYYFTKEMMMAIPVLFMSYNIFIRPISELNNYQNEKKNVRHIFYYKEFKSITEWVYLNEKVLYQSKKYKPFEGPSIDGIRVTTIEDGKDNHNENFSSGRSCLNMLAYNIQYQNSTNSKTSIYETIKKPTGFIYSNIMKRLIGIYVGLLKDIETY